MIRVLLADDHAMVRKGFRLILEAQPDMEIVGEAGNGREAVDLWRKHRPDVGLVDLRMPLLDGVGAIDEIRRQDALARVIVLTTFDTDADISKAIKAGAKGYLLKDAQREELLPPPAPILPLLALLLQLALVLYAQLPPPLVLLIILLPAFLLLALMILVLSTGLLLIMHADY